MLRPVAPFLILGLLPACNQEPSFDQSYEERSKEIGTKANSMERDMAAQMSGAAQAERAAAEAQSTGPAAGNGMTGQ